MSDATSRSAEQARTYGSDRVLVSVGFLIFALILLAGGGIAYLSHLAVTFGLYLLLAYSLNLITGFGGLIVFCHASFYGLGAYAYALARHAAAAQDDALLWTASLGWLPAVLVASAVSASLAAVIGKICLRFRGDRFIFATLGFQMIIFVILYNWVGLGRGPFGLSGIARPDIFGQVVREPWKYLILVVVVLAMVLPLLFRLYRSPFGLALLAMREDESAARSIGIDTNALALRALMAAAGVAGCAGALYAGYATYIDPTLFSLRESIFVVTLLLLGGGGNIGGPLVGAAVMVFLPEALRLAGLPDQVATNVREIIYGMLLAALMFWRPQGLAGAMRIRT